MEIIHPSGWERPSGFNHAVKAEGELVFVAGQIARDHRNELVSDTLTGQVRKSLENICEILREAGARPNHIVRMNWYMDDREEYIRLREDIGEVYRSVIGDHYPAMSLFEVNALLEEDAKVEIEATAVIPPEENSTN